MKRNHLLYAVAALTGCTMGAGFLGIPYVVSKVGFFMGAAEIIAIGLIMLTINLMIGEITLRTPGLHQLTGYAEKYLGKYGKRLMGFSIIFGIYGASIACLIIEGNFLSTIFTGNSQSHTMFSILFFCVMAFFIFLGLEFIAYIQLSVVVIFLCVIAGICIIALPSVSSLNLITVDFSKLLIPYGVILFAFLGTSAVPEMREETIKEKNVLKNAIIIGTLIPLIVYIIFSFIVVGITGSATTETAIEGLGKALGAKMLLLGFGFACLTMATAFLTLGVALREIYMYDYGMDRLKAWFLVCFVPFAIFLFGIKNIMSVLGITGGVSGGLTIILIVLMHRIAKKKGEKKPEYSIPYFKIGSIMLCILLGLGIVYEILSTAGII